MAAKDNFSEQSKVYAKFRPHYPDELFSFLYRNVSRFNAAWDCGTGNGQVACQLAMRFKQVYATDISQKQLDNASPRENISYMVAPAEKSLLPAACIDLITVAQALHWFNARAFYQEVQRIAAPGALLAYWGYHLPKISKELDPLLRHFHDHIVGPYWDPERKILLDEYSGIHFPLKNVQKKRFEHVVNWNLDHLKGYLNSWSSVQQYIRSNGDNPVDSFITSLSAHWRDDLTVCFPIFLTLGQI